VDAGNPGWSDDDGDCHVPLEDLVASIESPQPEPMKRTWRAQQGPAGFHPDEPADGSAGGSRGKRDQHNGGDIQLVTGG